MKSVLVEPETDVDVDVEVDVDACVDTGMDDVEVRSVSISSWSTTMSLCVRLRYDSACTVTQMNIIIYLSGTFKMKNQYLCPVEVPMYLV
jgi:hypothetical protein